MTHSIPDLDFSDDLPHSSKRVDRDQLYLQIARLMGLRTTCPRAQGGTVITVHNRIVTTGYAGAPTGMDHCLDVGCLIGPDGGCQRTLHAEIAALTFAARNGIPIDQGVLYTTMSPCLNCAKAILNSGIVRVVYQAPYRIFAGVELLLKGGCLVERMSLFDIEKLIISHNSETL